MQKEKEQNNELEELKRLHIKHVGFKKIDDINQIKFLRKSIESNTKMIDELRKKVESTWLYGIGVGAGAGLIAPKLYSVAPKIYAAITKIVTIGF